MKHPKWIKKKSFLINKVKQQLSVLIMVQTENMYTRLCEHCPDLWENIGMTLSIYDICDFNVFFYFFGQVDFNVFNW